MLNIVDYLEELVLNYNQACQRPDGSIYGIEDGKQCRKGLPVVLSDKKIEKLRKVAQRLVDNFPELTNKSKVKDFAEGKTNLLPQEVVYRIRNFNKKPNFVRDEAELERSDKVLKREDGSSVVMYRGSPEFIEPLKNSRLHGVGRGMYGAGTYAAAGGLTPNYDSKLAKQTAISYSKNDEGEPFNPKNLIAFGLDKNANVETIPEGLTFNQWRVQTVEKARRETGLEINDIGVAAAILGIDAYRIPGTIGGKSDPEDMKEDYWVILNRGSMIIAEDMGS